MIYFDLIERIRCNMLCCLLGKRLGARYTMARIRDPEYNESLSLLQKEIAIDNAINPERATALEISRLLRTFGSPKTAAESNHEKESPTL